MTKVQKKATMVGCRNRGNMVFSHYTNFLYDPYFNPLYLMIDKKIIDGLRRSDRHVVDELYQEFRQHFLSLGRKYKLSDSESIDIFHDSLIILRSHAQKGNLDRVRHQLSTYFMAIGKYRLFAILKKRNPEKTFTSVDIIDIMDEQDDLLDQEVSYQQRVILQALSAMSPSCRNILTLFYVEGLSIDKIVTVAGYENAGVVRAQKSRCLKQLNERIHGKRTSE
jgi:RNA polymerase sigma factor (sigma-70 family)